MWQQFLGENIYFGTNLFAALTFFSVFWLYFDAWAFKKSFKEGLKVGGYLLLAIGFLFESVGTQPNGIPLSEASTVLRTVGYLLIVISLMVDPLLDKPKLSVFWPGMTSMVMLAPPIMAVACGWWYLRRATVGLENHIKKIAIAFYFFAGFEICQTLKIFSDSTNVDLSQLTNSLGIVWFSGLILEVIGSSILISWAFSYLLKRISSQLFIILTSLILTIFLVVTISFSFLLLNNITDESLASLRTDASVMNYVLLSKRSEVEALATMYANDNNLIDNLNNKDKKKLYLQSKQWLVDKKIWSIVITDENGTVLARGEDKDRVGDSVSGDLIIKRTLGGELVTTMLASDQGVVSKVLVRVSAPVRVNNKIVGTVNMSIPLDDVYLDSIKKNTGMEMAIYSDNVLSAITIKDVNGGVNPVGMKETKQQVLSAVLNNGKDYVGINKILNSEYFVVYKPIFDIDKNPIGMMMMARSVSSVYMGANRAIGLTFLSVGILIVLSVLPTYLISKYISDQLK